MTRMNVKQSYTVMNTTWTRRKQIGRADEQIQFNKTMEEKLKEIRRARVAHMESAPLVFDVVPSDSKGELYV